MGILMSCISFHLSRSLTNRSRSRSFASSFGLPEACYPAVTSSAPGSALALFGGVGHTVASAAVPGIVVASALDLEAGLADH